MDANEPTHFERAQQALEEFLNHYFDGELGKARERMWRFILLMVHCRCTPGDFEIPFTLMNDYCNDVGIDFVRRFNHLQEVIDRLQIPARSTP